MKQVDDLSRSLTPFDQESAAVAVIELSNASWLVAAWCRASTSEEAGPGSDGARAATGEVAPRGRDCGSAGQSAHRRL